MDPTDEKVDRTAFAIVSLGDDDTVAYWRTRSEQERWEHIEYLRYINYADQTNRRFQRFFEIAKFPTS